MRGKGIFDHARIIAIRITPAYAGKSIEHTDVIVKVWDHPRLCGEKFVNCFQSGESKGSPPPMRGKAMKLMLWQKAFRITPAYAGKSRKSLCLGAVDLDHPRLCGEKTKKIPKQRYFFHQPASFSFSLQYT